MIYFSVYILLLFFFSIFLPNITLRNNKLRDVVFWTMNKCVHPSPRIDWCKYSYPYSDCSLDLQGTCLKRRKSRRPFHTACDVWSELRGRVIAIRDKHAFSYAQHVAPRTFIRTLIAAREDPEAEPCYSYRKATE